MKKLFLFLLLFAILVTTVFAQVSGYSFTSTNGTFAEISGGTIHGTSANDNENFMAVPIGFTFNYNGQNWTEVSINTNGFIAMGSTVTSSYLAISSATGTNNVIAAMNRDLISRAEGEIMTLTTGTAPNREFTVQWKHYRRYPTTATNDDLTFQIKLNETTNLVNLVYGPITAMNVTTAQTLQVGLRGADNTDFSNRTTTTDWAATTAGTAANATCRINATVYPASGLTFTWEPSNMDSPPGAALNPVPANNSITASIQTNLTWAYGGGIVDGYYIYFGTDNPPTNIVNGISQTALMYDPLDPLSYNTTYYWQIIPYNSLGNATDCPVWQFTTMSDPTITSLPYNQNFDAVTAPALPVDWNFIYQGSVTTGYVKTVTNAPYSTANCVEMFNSTDASANIMLIAPPMGNAISMNTTGVKFYAKGSAGYSMSVGIMTDHMDADSYTLVQYIDLSVNWTQYTVSFAGYTGAGRFIAFKHSLGGTSRIIYVDDVEIYLIPQNDLGVTTLTGDITPICGNNVTYIATVFNWGSVTQTNYSVKLYDVNNVELATANGVTVSPGAAVQVPITWTPSVEGTATLYAKVVMASDQNPENDQSPNLSINVLPVGGVIEVTVGAGDQLAFMPVDMYYKNSLFETLYYPAELGAFGNITDLTFYNNFVTNLPNKPTKIWLGTTTSADLSTGWIPSTQLTLVYDGNVNYPSGQNTITIPLQNAFSYAGGNLVMMVNRPMDTAYFSSSDKFYAQTVGTNRSRYARSDTVIFDPAAPQATTTISGQFPKTTFHMTPISAEPRFVVSPNSMDYGTVLLNNTINQTFTILNGGGGTITISNISLSGSPYFSLQNVPTLPVNLTTGQSISFVGRYLPTAAGTHSGTISITDNTTRTEHLVALNGYCIDTTIYTMPYLQRFDSVTAPALPQDWSYLYQSTGSTGYVVTYTTSPFSVPNCVALNNSSDASANVMLIAPPLSNSTAPNTTRVKFYAKGTAEYTISVGMMSNNLDVGTYTAMQNITLSTTWTQYVVSFAGYGGSGRHIAFKHGLGGTNRIIYIDNVEIEVIPQNDLAATAITGNQTPTDGMASNYTVSVYNWGTNAQNNYTVKLFKQGDVEIGSVPGTSIAPGTTVQVTVPWTPSVEGPDVIYGKVVLAEDQNPTNDQTPNLAVVVQPPEMVAFTIGIGDQVAKVPLDMYYKNSLFETLYYPAEIENTLGTIYGVSFYNNFVTNLPAKPTKIWMGTTTNTDLSAGWIPSTELTLVFDGTIDYPSGENAIYIPFQTPFLYLNSQNLVLMVQRPMDTAYFSSSDNFLAQTIGTNRAIAVYSDSTPYDPAAPPVPTATQITGKFPKTTFHIIPGGVGHLYGTITGINDQPLEGVAIQFATGGYATTTNAQGQYIIQNIIPDSYQVSFSHHGYITNTQTVVIPEDETVVLNLTLEQMPIVNVSGTILASDTGVGLTGATITLSGYESYTATTDASGMFTIPGVYANETYDYTITATAYLGVSGTLEVGSTDQNMGSFTLTEIAYPVMGVNAAIDGNNIYLSWIASNPDAEIFADGFESYEDFSTSMNPWTLVDVDLSPTYEFMNVTYPNSVTPKSYMVFNPSATTPAVTGGDAHGGAKYAACFASTTPPNNDWLISPQIAANGVFKFWARSYTADYGLERFKVGVSTSGTAPADFTIISGANYVSAPVAWTEYTYDLSSYTGQRIYVGIQCISNDAFIFMVDDVMLGFPSSRGFVNTGENTGRKAEITVTMPRSIVTPYYVGTPRGISTSPLTTQKYNSNAYTENSRAFMGYKVYRLAAGEESNEASWQCLTNSPIYATEYSDTDWTSLASGWYKWAVKAVYSNGVMSAASISNVLSTGANPPQYGDGSSGNPYQIANLSNLFWISENSEHWDKHYLQTANIDASVTSTWNEGEGWIPIGNWNQAFTGSYDGGGYTISGLYINRPGSELQALFGYAYNTSFSNICLQNINTIGINFIGGLVGYNAYGSISNCYSNGTVSGSSYTGGLIGYYEYGSISNCYSTSTVISDNQCTGGLIGYSYYGSINNSYSTGIVSGSYSTGGLVGYSYNGNIENSYSTGIVSGSSYTGGLVGYLDSGSISNCYSLGSVSGSNNTGGLVGRNNYGNVSNSYCTGNVTGSNYYTGGLVGYNNGGTVSNSFWDMQTSGQITSAGGVGYSTAAMQEISTYLTALWEFKGISSEDIWNIGNGRNNGYPYLNWQYPQDPAYTGNYNPAITIQEVANITESSALCYGTIVLLGNPVATQYGICWNTSGNPTTSDNIIDLGEPTALGTFSAELTNLLANTTYYVNTYITSSLGIFYGTGTSFLTLPIAPITPQGDGSSENPYQIANLANLYWISQRSEHWDKYYLQTANIDASLTSTWYNGEGWIPIGNWNQSFTGSYNGAGYTISGLYINRPSSDIQALFGYTNSASFSNICLHNINIIGINFIGGLVGYNAYGSISNCYSTGTVSGSYSTGGLIGYSEYGSINNSYSTGTVSGSSYTGGLVGYLDSGSISNCYSLGSVSGSNNTGGLVGRNNYGNVSNSYCTGNVTGSNYYTGGLVGYSYYGSINNCYSTGTVSGSSDIGGLLGYNNGTVSNCFWDMDTSGQITSAGGVGYSTAAMQEISTYLTALWEFKGISSEDIWNIGNGRNNGYPYLNWQYPQDPAYTGNYNPAITIQEVANITESSALCNGTIVLLGNPVATQYGICWNTSGNPTTSDNIIDLGEPTALGTFSAELSSLLPNTTYYVNTYIVGSMDTFYGIETSFITLPMAPAIPAGDGSSENPYQIANLANLYWISQHSEHWDKRYIQTANIDASLTSTWYNGEGWISIGNWNQAFTGSYDGGGYTISGLYINRPSSDIQALFGYTNSASLSTLCLQNISISGSWCTGALVGYSEYGSINNSYSTGTVNGSSYTGGLVGYSYNGNLENSYSTGTVSGSNSTGGLVGYLDSGTISNCYSTGNVSGSNYTGGLVGVNSGSINNCYSTGTVSGSSDIGGLLGYNNGTVSNSCWDIDTSGQSASVGGVGYSTAAMKDMATFTALGWDFSTIWDILSGTYISYPFLRSNSQSPPPGSGLICLPAINPSPDDMATAIGIDAILSWEADGGTANTPTGYSLKFGTNNPPSNIINLVDIGNTNSYGPIPDLDYNTTYYWQIIPYNAYGPAANCPIWSFTTDVYINPLPVQNLFAQMVSNSVNISWDAPETIRSQKPQTVHFGQVSDRENGIDARSRTLQGYRVWRLLTGDESSEANWTLLTPNIVTTTTLTDSYPQSLTAGSYKWAVKAVYTATVSSPAAFSNALDLTMEFPEISLNNDDINTTIVGDAISIRSLTIHNLGELPLEYSTQELTRVLNRAIPNTIVMPRAPKQGARQGDNPESWQEYLNTHQRSFNSTADDDLNAGQTRNLDWLTEDPGSGTVAPGDSVVIDLIFNSTGLAMGTYAGQLNIQSNDPYTPNVSINLSLTVYTANFTTIDNENNAMTGVSDNDLDQYLYNDDYRHPIEFNIFVGDTEITDAQLSVLAWDVDETNGEIDHLYINGHFVGALTGADGQWSTSVFMIPAGWINPGPMGVNLVQVYVDVNDDGWATTIDWGQLVFGQATQHATIRNITLADSVFTTGMNIGITQEIDTDLVSQAIRIETNILDPDGINVAGAASVYTIHGTSDDAVSIQRAIPAGTHYGTYQVQTIVYDNISNIQQDIYLSDFQVIQPNPLMSYDPPNLDFGTVMVTDSLMLEIDFYNSGYNNLNISQFSMPNAAFHLSSANFVVPRHETRTLQLTYVPTVTENFNGSLTVTSNNSTGSVVNIPISAHGMLYPVPLTSIISPEQIDHDLLNRWQIIAEVTFTDTMTVDATTLQYRYDHNGNGVYDTVDAWTAIPGYTNATSINVQQAISWRQDGEHLAFEFRAQNMRHSGWSYTGTSQTMGITDDYYVRLDATPPQWIESFEVTGTAGNTVTLAWSPSADTHFDSYEIYYGTSEGVSDTDFKWDNIHDPTLANVSTTSTTITGLNPNVTYYFVIRGRDIVNNAGDFSDEVSAMTGQANNVQNLHIEQSQGGVTLSWSALPNASQYTIYHSQYPDGPWEILSATPDLSLPISTVQTREFFYVTGEILPAKSGSKN